MSGSEQGAILIRAQAKRNGITTLGIGVVGLFLSWLVLRLLPEGMFIPGVFATSLSIVALLIGWMKIREPAHSFALTRQKLQYLHRCGQWSLAWNNIQRIDTPRITEGLEQKDLPLVGIRLKQYQPLLESISPRLATNILMEQRPLLLHNREQQCTTGTCYGDDLLEQDEYRLEDGTRIKGIDAMLANRMSKLRASLGYDLFINSAELDRPTDEFVALLRQCQLNVSEAELEANPS